MALTKSTIVFGVVLGSILLLMFTSIMVSIAVSDDFAAVSGSGCNIAVVPLVGEMTTYDGGTQSAYEFENLYGQVSADHVVWGIEEAEANGMLGVMLRIDSGGGYGAAGEMVARALQSSDLPTLALIRSIGTSAAYLAATGTDTIVASGFADVGSLGVNMSYLEYSGQNNAEGISYVQLTSAEYKDYGSTDRQMTDEEKALIERDLKVYHDLLVKEVAVNRGLEEAVVAGYADGASVPAVMALEMGLIDTIGDEAQARQWFAEQLGMDESEIRICR